MATTQAKAHSTNAGGRDIIYSYTNKAELAGESIPVHELGEHEEAVHEMKGTGLPVQLDEMNVRADLDGGWGGWEADPKGGEALRK